ncbi:hypothetical protein NP493_265g01023 [Ridgeia piscesae]|uniref:Uncharacterized protein n=1 Tax=Ridgeia piscesae TaxID=27915 RepID=A0AAD9NXV4_RIDPI|nr:hypothetical protein NP493_265g01023 [Ridgeia piscesae]
MPSNESNISCAVTPLHTGISRRRVCADYNVLSKYHTRTARCLSVLRSVLSSIMMENGPLLHWVITGLAKLLLNIIVVYVCWHLKDCRRSSQRWLWASYAQRRNTRTLPQWRLSNLASGL